MSARWLACLAVAGCVQPRTELMLAATSDLPSPSTFDTVRLTVYSDGQQVYRLPRFLTDDGDQQARLPGTWGLYADDGSAPTLDLRLEGLSGNTTLIERRAKVPMVEGRTLFLRMALAARCLGVTCPDDLTCVDGLCADPGVDPEALPDWRGGLGVQTCGDAPGGDGGAGCAGGFCSEGACYLRRQPRSAWGFAPTQSWEDGVGVGPYRLATGDFDGDGHVDAVLLAIGSRELYLLRAGDPAPRWLTDLGDAVGVPQRVALADLDGDGDQDLVVSLFGGPLPLLQKDRALAAGPQVKCSGEIVGLAIADLVGDDHLDLALTDAAIGNGAVLVARGVGGGTFEAPTARTPVAGRPVEIAAADLNGDGRRELVAHGPDDVTVLRTDGVAWRPIFYAPLPLQTAAFALADFDGNGRLDVVTAGNQLLLLAGAGDGTFAQQPPIFDREMSAMAIGDLDGDGRVDVAASTRDGGLVPRLAVLRGDGAGLLPPAEFPLPKLSDALAVIDLDGDGRLDVVSAADGAGVALLPGAGW